MRISLYPQQAPVSKPEGRTKATLIPGDGVGPELCQVVTDVFTAAGVPVDFDEHYLSEINPHRSEELTEVTDSISRNGICLKGILATPDYSAEGDLKTLNMKLRYEKICLLIFFIYRNSNFVNVFIHN